MKEKELNGIIGIRIIPCTYKLLNHTWRIKFLRDIESNLYVTII